MEAMRSLLDATGFVTELLEDTSDAHLNAAATNATPAASGQLGLAVYVKDLGLKAGNARRSLAEGQVRLVRGVFRKE
jgi:sarcosine/dimethylglycine N-methyltransferase